MTLDPGVALMSVMYPVIGEYEVMVLIGSPVRQHLVDLRLVRSHSSKRRRAA